MAQHRNPFGFTEPPVDAMRAILARLAETPEERAALARSDQERGYLVALEGLIAAVGTPDERHPAYARAMGELAEAYPRDVEAAAFHARAILLAAPTFGRAAQVRARTADAARRVLELDPDHHGGLHYLIHALDSPTDWEGGLAAADRYQELAAGASHAVHMPSHIYMQAGMWDQVVAGNAAALRTSESWLRATGRSMEHLDHHAIDFLLYGYLQQGREADARGLLDLARDHRAELDTGALRWYDALWSARYAMELGDRSDVPLPRSGYQSVGEALGLGLHAVANGDREAAEELLVEIQARVDADAGVEWHIAAHELSAALDRGERAVEQLREAIAWQQEMPRPNETPVLVKPPEELLGEILLEHGDPAASVEAFRAGEARWPGRLSTRVGLARAARDAGDAEAARDAYAGLLEQLRQASPEHPLRLEATRFLEESGGIPVRTALAIVPGRAPGTLPEIERRGSGPVPMVIIPCMSCRWASFEPFMERNAARYTMYAVTLPGFGGTPLPELPTDTDRPVWFWNAVEAVSGLIGRENLRDVVLVGHSYGSVVATGVAARRPDRVRAFVNVDGNFMSDRSWFEDDPALRPAQAERVVAQNLPRLTDAEAWRVFNRSLRDDSARRALYHGMFAATSRVALMQYWRENTLVDLNALLETLRIPILDLQSISGDETAAREFRSDHAEQLRRNGAPPSTHTVLLSGTSHFVMEHRPALLDAMIAEFLAGGTPADFQPGAGGPRAVADVARAWVRAYRGTLAEDAGAEAIDDLLALVRDDVAYRRESEGVSLHGRAALREYLSLRLGGTRSPQVDLQALVEAGSDVVLTLGIRIQVRDDDGWVPRRWQQGVVLRIVDGEIVAVTDYW